MLAKVNFPGAAEHVAQNRVGYGETVTVIADYAGITARDALILAMVVATAGAASEISAAGTAGGFAWTEGAAARGFLGDLGGQAGLGGGPNTRNRLAAFAKEEDWAGTTTVGLAVMDFSNQGRTL